MRRTAPILAAALAVLAAGAAPRDEAAHWPSWRGPLHSGVAPGADPPVRWSETENVRWKVELPGAGHASPVVWGERIFVLSAVETEEGDESGHLYRFVVSAYERGSGRELWRTVVREAVPHESGHTSGSHASASPVTDGRHLFALFGSRGLYCLDMQGKIVWQRDLGRMSTRNGFGEGASPALYGDTLVVNWDHEGDSFIVALDKASGDERWRVPRDEPTSWSTPLVVEDGDRALVVVAATRRVRAYDLKTGKEVWETAGLGVNCIPSPVAADGMVFVMSGYREAAALAIRYPGARGDLGGGERIAWRFDRGLSYVPSPLLLDGKLYFLKRFGNILTSLDLATGAVVYEEQRLEGLGNLYASPVAAAGRIYLVDQTGKALVLRAGPQPEVLARNTLDDAFDASPAIAGDTLYLRGHRHLYAIAAAG